MIDLADTIIPKSDQLNADDLIAGPRDIVVRGVKKPGTPEQPVSIYFEGDNGKPWKPCKGMRRLLVQIWGRDGELYTGRSLRLVRDPTVTWAGAAIGGIRVAAASHLKDDEVTIPVTTSKTSRKLVTVARMVPQAQTRAPEPTPEPAAPSEPPVAASGDDGAALEAAMRAAADQARLVVVWNVHRADRVELNRTNPDRLRELTALRDELNEELPA